MKALDKETLYRINQKKAKWYKTLAPIMFWGLIVLAVCLFIIAIKNSVGNMDEITSMLNNKKFTGEELRANYLYLTEKYGEWVIGTGGTGFTLTFINVRNAVFGGVAVASGIGAIISFVLAFVLGKWLFPALAEKIKQDNQDMVNLTILENDKRDK